MATSRLRHAAVRAATYARGRRRATARISPRGCSATFAGPAVDEVHVDCSDAVKAFIGGRAYATAPSRTNAHLWSRVHSHFERDSFRAVKVPAHCAMVDVADGKLTECQLRGNSLADHWAEQGAALRAVDERAVSIYQACSEVVLELGKWVAQAAIIRQGIAAKDTDGVP